MANLSADTWWWDLVVGVPREPLDMVAMNVTVRHKPVVVGPALEYYVLEGGILVGAWLSGVTFFWRVPEPQLQPFLTAVIALQNSMGYIRTR